MWNYYRDESNDPLSTNSESFKYKTSIVGKTPPNNDSLTDTEVVIPLKYLSNFWRSLDIPLISCKRKLILTWSKNCVLTDMSVNAVLNPPIVPPSGAIFQITDTKFYVSVVTLSKENDIKLLEKLKSKFEKTIKWNKYRSQMSVQSNNSNLNYLIDSTFTNVHRLFVLSFQRIEEDEAKKTTDSFSHHYVPKVQRKDFNVLIDRKSFFDLPIKNEEEAYEKIIDMSNNNNYTTGNLLDFAYYKENYKLIVIDLSKQTKTKDPQEVNFIGKIEKQNNGSTMFFIIEKSEETTFEFLQNSVNVL